jgi:hypothetical protein
MLMIRLLAMFTIALALFSEFVSHAALADELAPKQAARKPVKLPGMISARHRAAGTTRRTSLKARNTR